MSELPTEIKKEPQVDRAKLVAEGARRAQAFIKDVVRGKKVHGKKFNFDQKLLVEINKRILYFAAPGIPGQLRDQSDVNTEVDQELVVSGIEARRRFPLFGRWLSENIQKIRENPEDLLGALQIAAAAHYGLTGPQLHPFADGNGRTARVLLNGILMLGTKELIEYGVTIPPVPILRSPRTEKGRVDPYILALRGVGKTRTTNPLEKYIAERWAQNLGERLDRINQIVKHPTKADNELTEKFKWRRGSLLEFIQEEERGRNSPHPLPDYFEIRHIRL